MSRRSLTVALSVAFVLSTCSFLQGQSTYGAVTGSVTDPSGAAITDAKVTLTNLGTAETRTQPTNADGLYSFVNLIPGNYKIDIEKPGFKHITRTPIVVEVQQSAKIDVTLPVGQANETVEVTSETPLLQSETSSLGQVVEQRKANELPLNGRNIYTLAAIAPSVIPQGNTTGSPVGKNPFDFANYQIGGSFANESAEYLDGQPLNIGYINLPLLVPTQDSISEFKVQYNNLGPEWGKFSGGVINLSTKSGTNTWHGSAYEYLRNKVFNSNEFFNKRTEIEAGKTNEPPPFTQNQYGGTIGGAVVKDRTVGFGSYEGFRLRTGTVFNTTVPTVAERSGQFADLCANGFTGPGGICADTLTDPVTHVTSFVHQLYDPLNVTNATTGARAPIANNDLTTLPYPMNPTALFLLQKYIPTPLSGGIANNFIKAASTGGNVDEYVARVDQNINAKHSVFGRFSYWKLLSLAQDPFGTGLCKDRCAENTKSKSVAIGYNYAINPNTIFNLNASISRFIYLRNPINSGFDVSNEGWTSATPGTVGNGNGNGNGEDFADFLLGYGNGAGAAFGNQTSGSLVISGPISGKQTYRAFFFGDTWHVTNKLTLNLGVRYELQG